jgi:hypothetical protein
MVRFLFVMTCALLKPMAPGSTSPPKLCPILTKRLHVHHAPPLSALEEERVPTVLLVATVTTIVRRRVVPLITSGPNSLVLEEADQGIEGRGDESYYDEKLVLVNQLHLLFSLGFLAGCLLIQGSLDPLLSYHALLVCAPYFHP